MSTKNGWFAVVSSKLGQHKHENGGCQNFALYFETRHSGKPGNPLKWCRNKPKRVSAAL